MSTTSDLSKFTITELKQLELLLKAYREQGLPTGFIDEDVTPLLNENSRYIFLSNSDHQVCMLNNDDKLKLWHTCHECGHEGFIDEFEHHPAADLSDYRECEQAYEDALMLEEGE